MDEQLVEIVPHNLVRPDFWRSLMVPEWTYKVAGGNSDPLDQSPTLAWKFYAMVVYRNYDSRNVGTIMVSESYRVHGYGIWVRMTNETLETTRVMLQEELDYCRKLLADRKFAEADQYRMSEALPQEEWRGRKAT